MSSEVALLEHVGQAFLHDICFTLTQSALYGLYLAVFGSGIRALLARRPRTRHTWILFGFLTVLFIFFTINVATQIAFLVRLVRGILLDNPDKPFTERYQLAGNSTIVFGICLIWFSGSGGGGFLFVFADAVVVWRAWVLWPGNKLAKIVPLVLLFASFASVIASSTLDTLIQTSTSRTHSVLRSSPAGIMLSLSICLSLATNAVATGLIGYKAYMYRKTMKNSLGIQSATKGATMLILLTESGVAFCILQVIALAINMAENTLFSSVEYGAGIWAQCMIFAAAAYPVIVIIIVDSHRSISDHTRISADPCDLHEVKAQSYGIGTHISFAPRRTLASSNGVDTDSTNVSDKLYAANSSTQHNEESIHLEDLEKGGDVVDISR